MRPLAGIGAAACRSILQWRPTGSGDRRKPTERWCRNWQMQGN